MLHYDLGDVYDCFEWSKHHGNSGIEKESNSFGGYQTNFVILNVMLRYISRNCKIQNKDGNIIIYTREYCVGIQNEKSKMREYVFIVTRFRINSGILLVWQKKQKKSVVCIWNRQVWDRYILIYIIHKKKPRLCLPETSIRFTNRYDVTKEYSI